MVTILPILYCLSLVDSDKLVGRYSMFCFEPTGCLSFGVPKIIQDCLFNRLLGPTVIFSSIEFARKPEPMSGIKKGVTKKLNFFLEHSSKQVLGTIVRIDFSNGKYSGELTTPFTETGFCKRQMLPTKSLLTFRAFSSEEL